MKILIVNKFLYRKGGDAISALDTGELLSSKGHDVMFWGMNHPSNLDYPYKKYFVPYVDYYNTRGINSRIKLALNILYSYEAKSKIEALIKKEKPDIVHLHNFAHQISPSILHAFKKYDIPVVMTMHDYKLVCPIYTMTLNGRPCERCKDGKFYQCFINRCNDNSSVKSFINMVEMYLHHNILKIYDLVNILISPSVFLKLECEKMGLKKEVEYLPNFIDTKDFVPSSASTDSYIVYFGRLSKEKGLFTLIEALKQSAINLKIVGDGPIKESLAEKVKINSMNNVEFLGYKSGEELKGVIRRSKCIVLPSEWYENNPRSIMEGFALEKPAIGSRIGGIPELIKDGVTGFTFEPGNALDLRAKIQMLLNDPEKLNEMGKNARKFLEDKLNPENHYEKLMAIYQKVLNK